jgi:hypothetical protein
MNDSPGNNRECIKNVENLKVTRRTIQGRPWRSSPSWLKMVKKKRRKIMQGVIDLPIPVLLVLVCDGIFVGGIVDQRIIEQFFPDDFGRIKVQAEEIGRTFEFNFLSLRENGETGLREACCCAFPTDLQ